MQNPTISVGDTVRAFGDDEVDHDSRLHGLLGRADGVLFSAS
jgi:hypothetical protein